MNLENCLSSCVGLEGAQGDSDTPLENQKAIGFLSNIDPLVCPKLPSQYSMLGHHQPTREMSFKWRFAGGTMMTRFYMQWYLDPLSPHQLKKLDPLRSAHEGTMRIKTLT